MRESLCESKESEPDDILSGAFRLEDQREDNRQNEANNQLSIPTWSAYNSTLKEGNLLPLTKVHTPPLIAAPAHVLQTLLIVLKQAQNITTKVTGSASRVITIDMSLYKPAKQLQMSIND